MMRLPLTLILRFCFFLGVCSCFLASCCCWDPGASGIVAMAPECRWTPSECCEEVCDVCDACPELTYPEGEQKLTVVEMIDIALCNHPETHATWAQARSAAFEWQASRAELYPQLNLEGNVVYEDTLLRDHFHHKNNSYDSKSKEEGATAPENDNNKSDSHKSSHPKPMQDEVFNMELAANYLLMDFGGRNSGIQAACYALESANWTHNRAIQNVMIGVLRSYYAYIDAQASLEAKQQDLKDAHTNLEAAEGLFGSGVSNRVDVLQAKSNRVGTLLEVEDLEGEVKILMGRLANAMGLSADTQLSVVDLPHDLALKKVDKGVSELVAEAKAHRPDLSASEAYYRQKTAEYDMACSAGRPVFSLNAGIHRDQYFHAKHPNERAYYVGVGFDIPIFNGYFYKNEQKRALADSRMAYANMKGLESDVTLQVVTSYNAFITAVQKFKHNEEFLEYTQETYDAMLSNYKEGISTILDLLAAQNTLASARARWIHSRTQWVMAVASLAYATGTL